MVRGSEGRPGGGRDEVDVVELTAVQLHPGAALLPPAGLHLLLLVPPRRPLAGQVGLHPRLLPVHTEEGRVVEGVDGGLLLLSLRYSG